MSKELHLPFKLPGLRVLQRTYNEIKNCLLLPRLKYIKGLNDERLFTNSGTMNNDIQLLRRANHG